VEQYRALTEKAAKAADRARKAEAKAGTAEEKPSETAQSAGAKGRRHRKTGATVLSH